VGGGGKGLPESNMATGVGRVVLSLYGLLRFQCYVKNVPPFVKKKEREGTGSNQKRRRAEISRTALHTIRGCFSVLLISLKHNGGGEFSSPRLEKCGLGGRRENKRVSVFKES